MKILNNLSQIMGGATSGGASQSSADAIVIGSSIEQPWVKEQSGPRGPK